MKKNKSKGLTVVETILVLLCILFFIIGGLLLKYDRPLIEEKKNDFATQIIIEKSSNVDKKTTDKISSEKEESKKPQ